MLLNSHTLDKDKGTMPKGESTVKTIIYYFTGTGNSLAAAKRICTHLGDCELVIQCIACRNQW